MALHATIAPWAEEAPGAPYPMTIADLLALPEDAKLKYEVLHGRLVRTAAGGARENEIAARLIAALDAFVHPHNLGQVTGAGLAFNLTPPGARAATGLVPDVAFVRGSRLLARKTSGVTSAEAKKVLRLAPDLAVEVTSPGQARSELLEKVKVYLAAGVRLVWVIWPAPQRIDAWLPPIPIGGQPAAQLGRGDALDGSPVLQGFTCPVATLLA